jgi:ribosomal protein S17E
MKTLLLTLMTVSMLSTAQAKGLIGIIETYIIKKNGKVINVASNEISKDGRALYFDYSTNKKKLIEFTELSKATKKEIAGVKAGEMILLTTKVSGSNTELISRYCEVSNVFENHMADVSCKMYERDKRGLFDSGSMRFIVKNVRSVIAEVASLNGIRRSEVVELRINTKNAKAGKNVRVLAIFANGEALVQKIKLSLNNTPSIIHKKTADRVRIADLSKLN